MACSADRTVRTVGGTQAGGKGNWKSRSSRPRPISIYEHLTHNFSLRQCKVYFLDCVLKNESQCVTLPTRHIARTPHFRSLMLGGRLTAPTPALPRPHRGSGIFAARHVGLRPRNVRSWNEHRSLRLS